MVEVSRDLAARLDAEIARRQVPASASNFPDDGSRSGCRSYS